MNEKLKSRIQAAAEQSVCTLRRLDMNQKGATITAAKLQARAEAFEQVIAWSTEFRVAAEVA